MLMKLTTVLPIAEFARCRIETKEQQKTETTKSLTRLFGSLTPRLIRRTC
jgi:hypothetical protein